MTRADHHVRLRPDPSRRSLRVDPDPQRHDAVINVQGDLPTIAPAIDPAHRCAPLADPACDIATLGVEIADEAEKTNPNVVKIVAHAARSVRMLKALYFTRATAPSGDGPLYHHMSASTRIAAPRSPASSRCRLRVLEQSRASRAAARALEAGMDDSRRGH
jgi:3-deoxy-manno-octulosonate cytidylyltransferase (CMP-KDO synthetase)